MFKPKMRENQQDFHCQNKHDSSIHLVVLDQNLDKKERLLCNECMENFKSDAQTMEFKKVNQIIEDIIEQNMKSFENISQQTVQQLQTYIKSLQELKTQFIKLFDTLIKIAEDWSVNLLEQIQQYNQYSFYDELDSFIKNKNTNYILNDQNIQQLKLIPSKQRQSQIQGDQVTIYQNQLFKFLTIREAACNAIVLILLGQLYYQPKRLILKYGGLQMENQNQQKY
ncbi:unnamed protein product [Paramecium sonneborni]|uniref:Uncharacterized protein n=1 Tax=Paramecium sonneborni TaxID=65129 RepID=A0A8S1NR36_9CILI|nr:unnamed protein product [Paramecium sonneborni]